jgi:hypothetical protein
MFDAMGHGRPIVRAAFSRPEASPAAVPMLHGVGRDEILAVTWQGIPPHLRHLVRDIELSEGPSVPHQGLVVETVTWRALAHRNGHDVVAGTLFIWDGRIL